MNDNGKIVIAIIVVLSIFSALLLSAQSNEKWRKANPNSLSYHWGFYFGWLNLLFDMLLAAFAVFAVYVDEIDLLRRGNRILLAVLVLSVTGSLLGYGVIKRNRFAWIAATLLTFNPVGWAINYFYGRRRWGYLTGGYREFLDLFRQKFFSLPRNVRIAVSGSFLWFCFVFISWDLLSLSDHFYEDGAVLKLIVFPPTFVLAAYFTVTKLWK